MPLRDTGRDDFSTIDGIIGALYEVISGPAGHAPGWARERTLFAPGARLMPVRRANGRAHCDVFDVEGYIESRGAYLSATAFFERQACAAVDRNCAIAHVMSSYESSATPDSKPFARGVNSIQLWWDGTRWWILSV